MLASIVALCLLHGIQARDARCSLDENTPLIPHDYECEKYYKCDNYGELITLTCPNGLEFDADQMVIYFMTN